jgi:hypothetical protein
VLLSHSGGPDLDPHRRSRVVFIVAHSRHRHSQKQENLFLKKKEEEKKETGKPAACPATACCAAARFFHNPLACAFLIVRLPSCSKIHVGQQAPSSIRIPTATFRFLFVSLLLDLMMTLFSISIASFPVQTLSSPPLAMTEYCLLIYL